jgi:hypothetical protein
VERPSPHLQQLPPGNPRLGAASAAALGAMEGAALGAASVADLR